MSFVSTGVVSSALRRGGIIPAAARTRFTRTASPVIPPSFSLGYTQVQSPQLHKRSLTIHRLDHLVITCHDIDRTIDFYKKLGMHCVEFGQGRKALCFGEQKLNLHQKGKEFEPKAYTPQPGSQDLCFVTEDSIAHTLEHLSKHDITVIEGPVKRTGAVGPILSVYVRDPDDNLIEISSYEDGKNA